MNVNRCAICLSWRLNILRILSAQIRAELGCCASLHTTADSDLISTATAAKSRRPSDATDNCCSCSRVRERGGRAGVGFWDREGGIRHEGVTSRSGDWRRFWIWRNRIQNHRTEFGLGKAEKVFVWIVVVLCSSFRKSSLQGKGNLLHLPDLAPRIRPGTRTSAQSSAFCSRSAL